MVDRAALSPDVRRKLLEGLGRLPPLYEGLERTYESRFHDAIVQTGRAMLRVLADADDESPDAAEVAEGMIARLQAMHERLGIPPLGLKPPARPRPARKKAR